MGNKSYQCFKFSNLLSLLIIFYASPLFFSQLVIVSGQLWDGIIVTQSDLQSLQAIKHDLVDPRGHLRTWNGSGSEACSGKWVGIKCLKGQVIAVQLPWKGLGGRISEKIGQLQALRRISLHDNFLTGNVPWSLSFLPNLRGVYLFNNRLSGSVPPSIGNIPLLQTIDLSNNSLVGPVPLGLGNSSRLFRVNLSFNLLSGSVPVSLVKSRSLTILALQHNKLSGNIPIYWSHSSKLQILTLDHNNLTGPIPLSLSNLTQLEVLDFSNNAINGTLPENLSNLSSLVTLNLGQNKLSGPIPESFTKLANLSSFNVSHNNLSGSVPSLLAQKFNSSSFVGNLQLCGFSNETICNALSPRVLPTLPPEASPKSHKNKPKKLSTKDILLIAAGALLVVLLLLCCFLLFCFLRKRASSKQRGDGDQKASSSVSVPPEVQSGGESGGKLVHFDGPFVFTADDLLCATAEIMGKSSYGTSYKATLEDGSQVAVKRLREKTTKGLKEFEAEVAVLGKIRHPNLVALRAYYLGPKGEKLLVFDYMPKGSLATFLHARGPETIIDWSTRMAIAAGVTRGLLHLHEVENTVHGNLTSSNILLDERARAHIADTGLARLMTAPSAAQSGIVATTAGSLGYNAPELTKTKKSTQKTDVYSLGVVILELLTGKSPGEPVASNGMDLPQWVASIVKEEWTNEVFDLDLMRDGLDIGDELLNTLKLALHCVDPSPEARPEVRQVLGQLEEIKPDVVVSHEEATTATKNDE